LSGQGEIVFCQLYRFGINTGVVYNYRREVILCRKYPEYIYNFRLFFFAITIFLKIKNIFFSAVGREIVVRMCEKYFFLNEYFAQIIFVCFSKVFQT
jgi:hypothetical protein